MSRIAKDSDFNSATVSSSLKIPVGSTAIKAGNLGDLILASDHSNALYFYNGTAWVPAGSGGGGAVSDIGEVSFVVTGGAAGESVLTSEIGQVQLAPDPTQWTGVPGTTGTSHAPVLAYMSTLFTFTDPGDFNFAVTMDPSNLVINPQTLDCIDTGVPPQVYCTLTVETPDGAHRGVVGFLPQNFNENTAPTLCDLNLLSTTGADFSVPSGTTLQALAILGQDFRVTLNSRVDWR
jgi:hypothetical protein